MKNQLKPLLSIIALGGFLVIALATAGLNASTNTSVVVGVCKPKPPLGIFLSININFTDYFGFPVKNATGKLLITHQTIIDTLSCESNKDAHLVIDFVTDDEGFFVYHSPTFTQKNESDLFRVELVIYPGENNQGVRAFKVARYDEASLIFNVKELLPL